MADSLADQLVNLANSILSSIRKSTKMDDLNKPESDFCLRMTFQQPGWRKVRKIYNIANLIIKLPMLSCCSNSSNL